MADESVTIRREQIGRALGGVDDKDIPRINIALAFVMALADSANSADCDGPGSDVEFFSNSKRRGTAKPGRSGSITIYGRVQP